MAIAEKLDSLLKSASIPIYGVSLGDVRDKRTWRVDFEPSATLSQRKEAESFVSTFDASTVPERRPIETRKFFRRFTPEERARIRAVSASNDAFADFIEDLRSGQTVDLGSDLTPQRQSRLKGAMMPTVWATEQIANQRIAALLA